ncbi:MAG: DUF2304 domain-containing protein [Patescibacteria group bacterium]|jgi:hypothetical protein
MIFQIILVSFAAYAIYKTWKQYSKKEASKYWAIAFTLLWIVVIAVALVPNLANIVANFVGIGRGADVIVYSAIVVLTFTVYRLMIAQQKLSAEMTSLVRAVAIENVKKPNE